MCAGDKILPLIKDRQIKPSPLKCTVSADCWCMRVQTKFSHSDGACMSPAEMLQQTDVEILDSDREYLESLTDRDFMILIY